MNPSDTRVSSYLDDLARMLTDLDPTDRDEVLAGVREHLDATLAEHPNDPGAVDAALLRLGPPERIAAEARGGAVPASPGTTEPTWPRVAVWLVGLTTAPALALLGIVLLVDGAVTTWGPTAGSMEHTALLPHPTELVFATLLLAPVWVASVVATAFARQLSTRSRTLLVSTGPAALLLTIPSLTAGTGPGTMLAGMLQLGLAAIVIVVGRDALLELRCPGTRGP